MYIEIKIALNFLLSYLYDKLPRRRVNLFGEELEKYIGQKLTLTNWTSSGGPNSTSVLNEAHCINLNRQEFLVDPCIVSASTESALDLKEILAQLPDYIKLFIEPGLVGYLVEPPPCPASPELPAVSASQFDLKILYKLPQIDVASLCYVNSASFTGGQMFKDPVFSSDDSVNSILNENLLQLLNAAASLRPSSSDSSSPPMGASAAASPLQYFMQKLTLGDDQVMANLNQLPAKKSNLGFQLKPNLSSTDPILQSDLSNRNAISPTANNADLWSSSSSSSCSSSSSSTGGSSSCLSMIPPVGSSSKPDSSLLLNAVDPVKTTIGKQPTSNIPVKPPSSLFTTAEFAQTKFGSTKSKNSYYSVANKGGNKTPSINQPVTQPLLSPSHHIHPNQFNHHQQQKMNPEFSAYIKQKAAVQQLLKTTPPTPTSPPVLGSHHSTSSSSLLNNFKPQQPQDTYLDLGLASFSNLFDIDANSTSSSSSTASLTSPQQQQQLNLLLMNLLKANNNHLGLNAGDYLSNPMFAPSNASLNPFGDLNHTNQHQTSFDSIVNSTIKEMIDDDYDESDEAEIEKKNRFDENNNDLASAVTDSSN